MMALSTTDHPPDLRARRSSTGLSLDLTSQALFWFAFSLPFAGLNLLMTRTFFALQRPWIPTKLAAINMAVDIIVSVALYKPLGIAGLVIGTAAANIVMAFLQFRRLRIGFNGHLDSDQTTMITARVLIVSALTGIIARLLWELLDSLQASRFRADRLRRRCRHRRRRLLRLGDQPHANHRMGPDRVDVPQPPRPLTPCIADNRPCLNH